MSEFSTSSPSEPVQRCPVCDSVVASEATRCLMCGTIFSTHTPELIQVEPAEGDRLPPQAVESASAVKSSEKLAIIEKTTTLPIPLVEETEKRPFPTSPPPVFTSIMRERQSPAVLVLTAVFTIFILVLGYLVWQYQDTNMVIALVPTTTPIPPTPTYTPTITPLPTETPLPTDTPTVTPTPGPTDTPQPPRLHIVSAGDTLIGLSLLYRVSTESIAAQNSFSVDTPIQLGQQLVVPWPTATPPLIPIGKEVNGELVIADPTGCDRYTVQSGDSLSGISSRFGLDYDLFRDVNRLTEETILQPGDTVCIPQIIFGGNLPPTPGPSPTATLTPPPAGPQLLYPINHATIEPPDGVVRLQWTAVKDLAEAEWYMVELTDLELLDTLPYRGFTRDTSFVVPSAWRPDIEEVHRFRWRVSIVLVTGFRADGQPIYTYGGRSSVNAFFNWLGDIPTPTPTTTPIPTVTP